MKNKVQATNGIVISDYAIDIINNSLIAITIVDNAGKIVLFNRGAQRLTGFSEKEALGRSIFDFYPEPAEIVTIIDRLNRKKSPVQLETTILARDGTKIHIVILISLITGGDGKTLGTLGISVDITERKRLEDELRAAHVVATLCGDVLSHNVSNYNQLLLGYLQLLEKDLRGDMSDKRRRYIESSLNQVERTVALIQKVKTLMRVCLEASAAAPRKTDVAKVVRKEIEDVKNQFPKDRIRFRPGSGKSLETSVTPLLGILVAALIENAVGNSREKPGEITVIAKLTGKKGCRQLEIAVEDSGPGLSRKNREKLLADTRAMAPAPLTSRLELAVAQVVVERAGGKIEIEERVAGDFRKGTRFRAILPVVEQ